MTNDETRELIDKAIAASDRVNHEELCSCDKPPEACPMYSHRPWSHDPEFVASEVLRLAADAFESTLTEPEWEYMVRSTGPFKERPRDSRPTSMEHALRYVVVGATTSPYERREVYKRSAADPWEKVPEEVLKAAWEGFANE